MTKVCSVPGCNKKHHAKGYCKGHYKRLYFAPVLHANEICTVEGCTRFISPNYSSQKMCEMHGTRLRRNGNAKTRKRARNIKSILEQMALSSNPLEYEIDNRTTFAEVARLYYGDCCHECGWNAGNCEVHHIMPKSAGGKNTINNAVVLCPNCHSLKHYNKNKRETKIKNNELIEILNRLRPLEDVKPH